MPRIPKRTRRRRSRTAGGKGLHGIILLTLLVESVFVVMLGFESRFAALFALPG